jgi:hypothetical protein
MLAIPECCNINNNTKILSVKHTYIYCTYVLHGQHARHFQSFDNFCDEDDPQKTPSTRTAIHEDGYGTYHPNPHSVLKPNTDFTKPAVIVFVLSYFIQSFNF